jgi:Lipoprotein LpqB beta-propeller domain/Sporulation and spore germination
VNARRLVIAAVAAALLTGCANVPTDGPVRSGSGAGDVGDPPFGIQAQAPRPGAGPRAIVNDFLDAMAAASGTDIARQYLTPHAAAAWKPDEKVTIFDRSDRQSIEPGTDLNGGADVALDAPMVATLDPRGVWRSAEPGQQVRFAFKLVKVNGQLRIATAPVGRLIASDTFSFSYQAKNLYFFTPKMDALVPDPVYVPLHGPDGQSATVLAQALLAGPTSRLGDAVLSAAPKGTEVVSVTVDADGVATVSLNDRVAGLGPDLRPKLAAQLAWTLRQVPGVLKLKLTAAGQPYEVEGTTEELPITRWDSYDAAFASLTGRQLYLLHDNGTEIGRLDGIDGSTQQTPAYLRLDGLQGLDKESVAVDLEGRTAAAVSGDTVVIGPIGTQPSPDRTEPVIVPTEGEVLRPSFDKDRNLWIVDRADGDARIRVRRDNGKQIPVTAIGLEGQRLTAFRVARDAVRVLAVVKSGQRSRLVLGRITGNEQSVTISAVQTLQLGFDDIAGAGWSRPTKIMVLGRTGSRPYQLVEVNIDGSELAAIQGNAVQDFNPVELATAPDGDALTVVRNANGDVLVRQRDLNWDKVERPGHPFYPG